jgi:hypothetical protein
MFQIYYEIQKRVLVRVMYQLNFEKSTILTPPHDFLSSIKFLHVLLKLEQFFHVSEHTSFDWNLNCVIYVA